ncbi:MAG: XdhC family protein [Gemmatimonadales bacterium]|jgi:xanthine dehydrogenase accessory factor|nr:MAG: XdhC family protein [Gemmatimonadales bacterium]
MSGPRLDAVAAAEAIVSAVEEGRAAVAVTMLEAPAERLLFTRVGDGVRRQGSSGDDALDRKLEDLARGILDGSRPEGRAEVGGRSAYLELHQPRPELVIVGAGHIAQPLAEVGTLLGFRVVVADDRPEFASSERFPTAARVVAVDFSDPFSTIPLGPYSHLVLVTRGHKYDYECLRRLLTSEVRPRYVGMIGSRRRVRATYRQLLDEGIPRERLAEVRAPVGLDLGAETPGEIAVAVAAEMVLEWRGGTGSPLHRAERVLERFFREDGEGELEP